MKVELELRDGTGTSQRELRSLQRWLNDSRAEHGATAEPVTRPPRPGEMGTGIELILASVSTGAALLQLVFAVDTWVKARRPRSQVVIHLHGVTAQEAASLGRAAPGVTVVRAEEADGDGGDSGAGGHGEARDDSRAGGHGEARDDSRAGGDTQSGGDTRSGGDGPVGPA
ncbi:effector-associated constant component EACC1 [Streptomyces sp. NPDC002640]